MSSSSSYVCASSTLVTCLGEITATFVSEILVRYTERVTFGTEFGTSGVFASRVGPAGWSVLFSMLAFLHCSWPASNDSSSMDRQSFSESITAASVRSCSRLFEENVFYVRANCGC